MKDKTPQEKGYEFEEKFAEALGAKPTRGSGNQWFAKMDIGGAEILWSCKHTDNESFRMAKSLMREVQDAIIGQGGIGGSTIPGMAISVDGEVYCTIRAEDFLRLIQEEVKFVQPSKGEAKRQRAKIPKLLADSDESE
jgi:hypothetical protein